MKNLLFTCLILIPFISHGTILSMLNKCGRRFHTVTTKTKKGQEELIVKLIQENNDLKHENWKLNQKIVSQKPEISPKEQPITTDTHHMLKNSHPYRVYQYWDNLKKNDPESFKNTLEKLSSTPE